VVAVECEIEHRPAGTPPSSPIYPMIGEYTTDRSGWTRPTLSSAPNSSRVARTLPLSMSLLARSGIEQMREPDTCLLQLLADDQRVRLDIGSLADASFA
jgi:hypothetical protein